MLRSGGSYVSLVSPGGCGQNRGASVGSSRVDYTMVIQTMEWELSKCFKDSHPPFTVAAQNASFRLAPQLLSSLQQNSAPQLPLRLFARRTRLYREELVDPVYDVPLEERPNRYFEEAADVTVAPDGSECLATRLTRSCQLDVCLPLSSCHAHFMPGGGQYDCVAHRVYCSAFSKW